MDMKRIETLMTDLQRARDIETLARREVKDAQANLAFYQKKLDATKAKLTECEQATAEASDRLDDLIIDMTTPSLIAQHG